MIILTKLLVTNRSSLSPIGLKMEISRPITGALDKTITCLCTDIVQDDGVYNKSALCDKTSGVIDFKHTVLV